MSRRTSRRLTQPSMQPRATRSPLERLPAEIWGIVFSLACVDDGYTGRSLSEVSRYINEASKSYKYQCIAVDHRNLRHFTAVLKKLPADTRRVQHLFISSIEIRSGREAKFFEADKNRLLITVAPTLRSLEVHSRMAYLALKFSLPSLLDLTVHGIIHVNIVTAHILACYPSLQRMHWASASTTFSGGLLPLIHKTAPALTHLRITISNRHYDITAVVCRELEIACGLPRTPPYIPIPQSSKRLLETMTLMPQVIVQPSVWDTSDVWRRIRDGNNTFRLLKSTYPLADVSAYTAKSSWLAMCAGTSDCWDIHDEDLDTESRSTAG
ncbi:hypothetical protein PILCRDRAFT_8811 [Piloderma croceum F 1598]|uniref:F-box domain-containing protein n=1 Tax=Piloderma croceum (strain F 1598) TaxID=765440 RepID=A0A0C3FQM3_PILCF|nr:hypothetical protein PILCRDRAFT_8811 [Piloderma croceum F 1598]